MWVCESDRCRERDVSQPSESRFTIEVDCWGDSMGGEFSCVYCGEYGYDCPNCESDYWCADHGNNHSGERVTSQFSSDLVWINKNKEPQYVIN